MAKPTLPKAGEYKYNIDVNSVIPFGKYKGLTFTELLARDHGYLSWAMEEKLILLTNKAFDLFNKHIR